MSVRPRKVQDLGTYYNSQASLTNQVGADHRVRLLYASPYDTQETLNWISKHLALPIIGIVILVFTFPLLFFFIGNQIFKTLIIILSLIAAFFIINYIRVLIFKKRYKITENGLITRKKFQLNKSLVAPPRPDKPHYKIGFVGDIMMLNGHNLQFDQPVKDFFDDVDVIVGNLEGILSIQPGPLSKQEHPDDILNQLISLFNTSNTKTKWLLCLSNNHSSDFGRANFNYSLSKIQLQPRINAFGRIDTPNVLLTDDILISSATQLSNQKNWDYISRFDKKTNSPPQTHNKFKYFQVGKFNILYPHWGYENESYVRSVIRKEAIRLLTGAEQRFSWIKRKIRGWFKKPEKLEKSDNKWDLIYGHHSHVRQPIMKVQTTKTISSGATIKINKLVAFSGGNFTSGARIIRKKKHIYGIIMKCQIGPLLQDPSTYLVDWVEWERTVNRRTKNPPTKTIYIDPKKERGYKISYLVILILILVAIFVLIVIQFLFP